MIRRVEIAGRIRVGAGNPLLLIAGPCLLESEAVVFETAAALASLSASRGIPVVFKGSFDKANRSSAASSRGPGEKEGLALLAEVRRRFSLPVTTDVHESAQVEAVARVADILQIPAFLCRQTDLLLAAGRTGLPVNVKKGQFMAPWDMENVVEKVVSTGNSSVLVTERGTTFGYNNLVVDFRGFPRMRERICPLVFDATHSVQLPGGAGKASSGDRTLVAPLARAAVAADIDALFLEVHPDPDRALSDAPNSLALADLPALVDSLLAIRRAASGAEGKEGRP